MVAEVQGDVEIIKNDEKITFSFHGALRIEFIGALWEKCIALQNRYQPESLILDMQQITSCDTAGLSLLMTLLQRQQQSHRQGVMAHLPAVYQPLLDKMTQPKKLSDEEGAKKRSMFSVTTFGYWMVIFARDLKTNIIFIGQVIYQLGLVLRSPRRLRWQDLWLTVEQVGPYALVIIVLIGFLIGLISAFQAAIPMRQFGVDLYIANLVGISLLREMGPLMTAVLLAGRTASSFAAEIGTMKVNQEIDALQTMGLDVVRFLVLPRIIATTLMTPLLNIFLIFFGLLGCAFVMHTLGFTMDVYIRQLSQVMQWDDFIGGMVKATAFGIVIASVGCLHGLKTRFGAKAVGYSTTQAVVNSIIMLILVDGIFACVYYALGV
ncbi:MAG: hypothetical protein A2X77_06040 [Gammaproteobacteria bacterium GWE2_42_36]|nr:MAG: hypothetical protein A2X77_06040 [Gammaproteobacteria bacterium GWE2_42_36]HCU05799.1 ABC transporter permease [Coxiellaceae bacterium]